MTDSTTLSIGSADEQREQTDELSDSDLEQVVGGLARVWHAEMQAIVEPIPAQFSVTSIVTVDAMRRMSA